MHPLGKSSYMSNQCWTLLGLMPRASPLDCMTEGRRRGEMDTIDDAIIRMRARTNSLASVRRPSLAIEAAK